MSEPGKQNGENEQSKATLDDILKVLEQINGGKDDILKVLEQINGGKDDSIEVHQKALDDLVSVNSLFTIAVFIGLSYAAPNIRSLETRPGCDADAGVAKRLILYEVNSFALFLFSSLVAKSLKVALNVRKRLESKKHVPKDYWCVPDELSWRIVKSEKWGRVLLTLSIAASFAGIVLLTLSMVNVIQIRVGKLGCGSLYANNSAVSLCVIVFAALLLYAPSMIYTVIVTSDFSENEHSSQAGPRLKKSCC